MTTVTGRRIRVATLTGAAALAVVFGSACNDAGEDGGGGVVEDGDGGGYNDNDSGDDSDGGDDNGGDNGGGDDGENGN
jgi:hypothetical protein